MKKAIPALVCLACNQSFAASPEPTFRERVEAARNWAGQHDWYRVFCPTAEPISAKGTWQITLTYREPWGQAQFQVILQGPYGGNGANFVYRAPLYPMLQEQAALFHLVHPEMSPEEIEPQLIYQELSWSDKKSLPPEGKRFQDRLANLKVPILPNSPARGCFILDIGWVELKQQNGMESASYMAWEANCGGEPPNPLVAFTLSESKRFGALWRKQQSAENYARLINRLNIPVLGYAFFEWACGEKLPAVAHQILDKGLNPVVQGPDGSWALIAAARLGDLRLVQRLVEMGAPVNVCDPERWGSSALGASISSGNLEVYRFLRKVGATSGAFDSEIAMHPIHEAAASGNLVVLRELLTEVGEPLPRDPNGQSLLCTASSTGQCETVRLLLALGHRPEAADLFRAVQSQSPATVQLLLDAGVDPNAAPWPQFTESGHGTGEILREAIQHGGDLAIIRSLLQHGADPEVRQPNTIPGTPIELAKAVNRPDIVAVLEAARKVDRKAMKW